MKEKEEKKREKRKKEEKSGNCDVGRKFRGGRREARSGRRSGVVS